MADGQETKKPADNAPASSLIDTSGDVAAAKKARDAGEVGLPKTNADAPAPVIDTSGDIEAAKKARDAALAKTNPDAVGVRNADEVVSEQKLDVPVTPASTASAPRRSRKKKRRKTTRLKRPLLKPRKKRPPARRRKLKPTRRRSPSPQRRRRLRKKQKKMRR